MNSKGKSENMINFDDGVDFDPGFIKHMSAFVPSIESIYGNINRLKSFNQKKMQFKMYYPRILKLIKNYLGFYTGCMLWAIVIQEYSDKLLLGNLCAGAEFEEDETAYELDFVIDYLAQLEKDASYYLRETFKTDEKTMNLLKVYREFLVENKGFVASTKVSDLVLPKSLKTPSKDDMQIILNKIEEVTDNGKIEELYQLSDLIL